MKRWTTTKTTVAGVLAACLLCCATAEAKKGGNGGGGGGETAPYTLVTLAGMSGYAFSVSEPDGSDAVCVVGIMDVGGARHPASWDVKSDGSFTTLDLGLPAGAVNAEASDVNDFGVITIHTEDTTEVDENGDLILPGWVLVPGLPLQELPRTGTFARGNAVNNWGDIVGYTSEGKALWELDEDGQPGTPITLQGFHPNDINDAGMMAGHQAGIASIAWFDGGGLQTQLLTELPGTAFSEAMAISADGTWVAGTLMASNGPSQAFAWSEETGMVGLGALGGTASYATGVNNVGEVVGWATDTDRRHASTAFLWSNGQMFDLNALAQTGSKINLDKAARINEAGHVVGVMQISRVGQRAFLLTPND